jgi:hypothetical protein
VTAVRAVAARLVFLAAIASCSTSGQPVFSQSPAASASAGIASAAPSATSSSQLGLTLGAVLDISPGCVVGEVVALPDAILWHGCDPSISPPASRIVEYNRTTKATRVLYEPKVGATLTLAGASRGWIAWFEYVDVFSAADSKLYAMARSGGGRVLLDDAATHGKLASLADAYLDGDDLYWTVPLVEPLGWHGRLMRQHLPDGQPEVVVSAPPGAIIGWPSAHGDVLAYELSLEKGSPKTRVRYRIVTGETLDLPDAPSSEPAVGDGIIVFKRSERYDEGEIAAFLLSDRRTVSLGPGEGPRVGGRYASWSSSTPPSPGLRIAVPAEACVVRVPPEPPWLSASPSLGSDELVWIRRSGEGQPPQIRLARIGSVRC